jgi:hypothetical protein
MLKDYIACQDALTDLATKLWHMKTDVMVVPQDEETDDVYAVGKLAKELMQQETPLSERLKLLDRSLMSGRR